LDSRRSGLFYSRYDEPNLATKLEDVNYFQKLYYHQLGKPQSEDVLVYERADQRGFNGGVTEDAASTWLFVWLGTDPRNLVFYKDLTDPAAQVVELIRNSRPATALSTMMVRFSGSKLTWMPPVVASLLLIQQTQPVTSGKKSSSGR